MIRRLYCVVLVCVVSVSLSRSEWVTLKNGASQPTAPVVTLLQDDQTSTVVKIEVSGFEATQFQAEGKRYQSIDLLTGASTTEVGFPELPCLAKILAVPDRAALSVEVVEVGEEHTYAGYIVPPARRSWKEGDPETPYVERLDAYQSGEPYPLQRASLDPPGVFRDFRIARVAVYPVTYLANKREIRVASSITIRIKYGTGEVLNPKTTPRRPIAPSFTALYRSSIFNYQSVLDREYGGLETGRDVLLCISPDAFVNSLMPFVNWRNKTGTSVKVTKFSDIGANSTNPDIIRDYIAQVYHSWTYPPTYVLLAGDYGYVPIKEVAYDYTIVSEDYYVEIDGNDFLPEMMIGRFTNKTDAVEQSIVAKIVGYERNPYTANTAWFKKGVVAGNNAYESALVTKRFARDRMMLDGGFTVVDTFMNHNPCYSSLSDLISVVNNGRSFLNYRGEGWYTGWAASCYGFQTGDVSSLNNGRMLPFVTSIGCGVGAFNQSSCFGEQWLELGTVALPRGAVTFIGPTSNTHTLYNNKIDLGIYMGMFQEGMETPGQVLARGRLYMYEVLGGNDPRVEYQTRIYCILGDPTAHIWKDVPRPVRVVYPSSIPIGYDQVSFTVTDSATGAPVAGAQICLAGDSVYTTGQTNQSGAGLLPVTPSMLDTLTVLVRGGNVVPYEGSVRIVSDAEHVAPFGDPVVVDLDGNHDGKVNPNEHIQISCALKNWGTQASTNIQATLSVADTTYVAIANAGPVLYGTLPPNGSGSGTGTPLQFYVKTTTPVGSNLPLQLNVTSSSHSWSYMTYQEVMGCDLQYVSTTVDDQGSPHSNGRLDPGETAIIYLTITNDGQDVAPNVAGILRSADPHVMILDSLATFGTVAMGGSSTNTSNYFVVAVDNSCPVGSSPVFTVQFSTQNGNYAYSVARDFSIPVGVPSGTDPTGPDGYGYYAFSSDDSLFEQSPHFNWVEIRSVGTRVPWATSGDFTANPTLPFSFKYYGTSYTSVRVSSDGWMALGTGTQTGYTNYSLPHNDNINNMVAVFWDDLFEGSSNSTSKLLYYNDVANHRFIAEWDSVAHYSGTTARESFEAILLDPAYYPTPTGDGDIVFQYRMVGEEGGCTTGIEDGTQTIGLQYLFDATYAETATQLRDSSAIRFTTHPPTIGRTNMTVAVLIEEGWNMISNPVLRPDSINGLRRLFPHAVSDYGFRFEPGTGYVQATVMPSGPGYWAKFPGGELNAITGTRILSDSIPVSGGWNIIGSISSYVDTSTIRTIPPGVRASNYFGYAGGYSPAVRLAPGQAYWVKATGSGQFVLGSSSSKNMTKGLSPGSGGVGELSSMTISDAKGGSQTLYFGPDSRNTLPLPMFAMPPLPPSGAFDARFENAEGGTMVRTHPVETKDILEFPIRVQSSAYPLTVKWQIVGEASYEFSDAQGGQRVPRKSLTGTGSLKIGSGDVQELVLRVVGSEGLPTVYALSQNYPNPFNPSTVIKYALPVDSRVSLKIFNILGQEICALVNDVQKAGYRSITWDSKTGRGLQASSGVYFVRLNAVGVNGAKFSDVRKMLLMK